MIPMTTTARIDIQRRKQTADVPASASRSAAAHSSPPACCAHIANAAPCRNRPASISTPLRNRRSPSRNPSSKRRWRRAEPTTPRRSGFRTSAVCNQPTRASKLLQIPVRPGAPIVTLRIVRLLLDRGGKIRHRLVPLRQTDIGEPAELVTDRLRPVLTRPPCLHPPSRHRIGSASKTSDCAPCSQNNLSARLRSPLKNRPSLRQISRSRDKPCPDWCNCVDPSGPASIALVNSAMAASYCFCCASSTPFCRVIAATAAFLLRLNRRRQPPTMHTATMIALPI